MRKYHYKITAHIQINDNLAVWGYAQCLHKKLKSAKSYIELSIAAKKHLQEKYKDDAYSIVITSVTATLLRQRGRSKL